LVVATGGTAAYAADTVFSSDIVDGEVKSVDIGNNEIGSSDVKDESINTFDVHSFLGADVVDDSLTAADLATGSVAGGEIANNAITAADLATGSVASEEIADFSLGVRDVSPVNLFVLNDDPDYAFFFPAINLATGLVVANTMTLNDAEQATYRLCNLTDSAINSGNIQFRLLVLNGP
jgi:hypothetical protein